MKSICVYCGSSAGHLAAYTEAAINLGRVLAEKNIDLVYGGANIGLMGNMADAALQAGGRVIGIMPQSLVDREVAHPQLSEMHIVNSMHERKALMEKLSDGFIALPGGMGTLDELFEILTWAQLNFHHKPIGLLNTANYFDHLLAFLDHSTEQGFVKAPHRQLLLNSENSQELLQAMANYQAIIIDKRPGKP